MMIGSSLAHMVLLFFYLYGNICAIMLTFSPCLLSWGHFAQEEVEQKEKSKDEEE